MTPWTVARKAPLSMGLSQQKYWSGLPFSPPGTFLTQRSKLVSCASFIVRWILYHWATWEASFVLLLSSVPQSYPTLRDPMDCNTPGLPVHHQLPEFTQTHVHWISDAIQPSHPLLSPSPPTSNLSQHQGLFQWVSSSNHVAKGLEVQLQHQSCQWIFRTDLL